MLRVTFAESPQYPSTFTTKVLCLDKPMLVREVSQRLSDRLL